MGFSNKHQKSEGGKEADAKKWVIAGIPLRTPLKPISVVRTSVVEEEENENTCLTTPTGREFRIPEMMTCPPPPPRKRRPASSCRHVTGFIEIFIPPDLESVFAFSGRRV